ncbi:hypothetical protein TcasGA2_TC014117 [Tribolium castaneum]|uniref:Uncharacterized protein n=1 Tax=Tribolium castaneum TaxID=7070 RepID=D6WKB1_TRICA|nr:hypothetical protein TcasGA2_TC014117 [Tribolium castaneum]
MSRGHRIKALPPNRRNNKQDSRLDVIHDHSYTSRHDNWNDEIYPESYSTCYYLPMMAKYTESSVGSLESRQDTDKKWQLH